MMFRNGLNLNYNPNSDTINGKLISAFNNYKVEGVYKNDTLYLSLYNGKGEIRGKILAPKKLKREYASKSFVTVTEQALDSTETYIYDPKIVSSKEWRKFKKNIKNSSKDIKEAIELTFAFYYYSQDLNISHFYLFQENKLTDLEIEEQEENDLPIQLSSYKDHIGILKINSFADHSKEIENILNKAATYDTLVVDLRQNQGGNIDGGFAFASKLIKKPMEGGYFLTRKWFEDNDSIPKDPCKKFPVISEGDYKILLDGIHNEKGVCLKLFPKKPVYPGKLYLLVGKNTASTCEPIAYTFKKEKLSTLIGENTAGAMLNAENFELTSDFKLYIEGVI